MDGLLWFFEIHHQGSLNDAIERLVRAKNKWNSEVCLIVNPRDKMEAKRSIKQTHHDFNILEPPFPQIRKEIRIMTTDQAFEWHDSTKSDKSQLFRYAFLKEVSDPWEFKYHAFCDDLLDLMPEDVDKEDCDKLRALLKTIRSKMADARMFGP